MQGVSYTVGGGGSVIFMQVQLSKLSLILKSLTRLEENIFELFLFIFKHEKLHLLAQN